MFGGQGNDLINYSAVTTSGNELIYGQLGDDTLRGGVGNDTIFGGQGNDSIVDSGGTNVIYGNLGDDIILNVGNGLHDSVYGGQGNDLVNYGRFRTPRRSTAISATIGCWVGPVTIHSLVARGTTRSTAKVVPIHCQGNLGNDIFVERTYPEVAHGDPQTTSGLTTPTADTIVDFTTGQDKIQSFISASRLPRR